MGGFVTFDSDRETIAGQDDGNALITKQIQQYLTVKGWIVALTVSKDKEQKRTKRTIIHYFFYI